VLSLHDRFSLRVVTHTNYLVWMSSDASVAQPWDPAPFRPRRLANDARPLGLARIALP
jgi:hypothetical protein